MIEIASAPALYPPEINGVPLFRKDGGLRARFDEKSRLAVLGPYLNELDQFMKLFARRQTPYITQRLDSSGIKDWYTVHHRLQRDHVVRHLLGDQLPGTSVLWLGTRSWETTRYVVIDIDYEGDINDFRRRCNKVKAILRRLGIPDDRLLEQATPSGGLHYYFFTYRPTPVEDLHPTFAMAGLSHIPGKHEIYPMGNRGLRLPFGTVPNQPTDPGAWVQFIQKYRNRTIPRVNWTKCLDRAYSHARRPGAAMESGAHHHHDAPIGMPRRHQETWNKPRSRTAEQPSNDKLSDGGPRTRYDELLSNIADTSEADELWRMGIMEKGTRVAATLKMAAHFIFIRRISQERAADQLTDWVYSTGHETSKDVQGDLAHRTRNVEGQTRAIVAWFVDHFNEGPTKSGSQSHRSKFTSREVDRIAQSVMGITSSERKPQLQFGLHLLQHCKLYGWRTVEGWEAETHSEMMRDKFPGCSGQRYRRRITEGIHAGLIGIAKEYHHPPKGQGRARTYAVYMPNVIDDQVQMSLEQAEDYGLRQLQNLQASRINCQSPSIESDKKVYGSLKEMTCKDRASEATDLGTDSLDEEISSQNGIQFGDNQDQTLESDHDRRTPIAAKPATYSSAHLHPQHPSGFVLANQAFCQDEESVIAGFCDRSLGEQQAAGGGQAAGTNSCSGRGLCPGPSRSQSAPADLGTGSAQRDEIETALQRLRAKGAERGLDGDRSFEASLATIRAVVTDPDCYRCERDLLLADPGDLGKLQQIQRTKLILKYRFGEVGQRTPSGTTSGAG